MVIQAGCRLANRSAFGLDINLSGWLLDMEALAAMNFIDRFIGKQILKRARKEAQMRGWMTKLAGVGGILVSAGVTIQAFSAGDYDKAIQYALGIFASLGALGIGRKLDRVTTAAEGSKTTGIT